MAVMLAGTILATCKTQHDMRLDRWHARFLDTLGVVFQQQSNDCGAACAVMVLQSNGVSASLSDVSSRLSLGREGATLLSIRNVLEEAGLKANGICCEIDHLRSMPLPGILLVEARHYLVLDSITSDERFLLRDPAMGRICMVRKGLERIWNGVVLTVVSPSKTEKEGFQRIKRK